MTRLAWLLPLAFAILSLSLVGSFERPARADLVAPRSAAPIFVLKIESNGPDDQADALSTALQSRVKAAGWPVSDSPHSLETLHLTNCQALPKPDAPCLLKIGDELGHADRFIWGTMRKSGSSQVTAEVHLWQRGKPDVVTTETYSDNLKDPSDDALQKMAEKIFATISGGPTMGSITVHAGAASGTVFVDGVQKAMLDNGQAKLELPTGSHLIEVRVVGYAPASKSVDMAAASERDVSFELVAAKPDTTPYLDTSTSKLPVRKIIAWTAIGLGAASMVVGAVEGFSFLSSKSDLNSDRANIATTVTDVCQDLSTPSSIDACTKFKDARSERTLELIFLGVGAVLAGGGVILLVTDKGGEPSAPAAAPASAFRITPRLSHNSGGLDLHLTF